MTLSRSCLDAENAERSKIDPECPYRKMLVSIMDPHRFCSRGGDDCSPCRELFATKIMKDIIKLIESKIEHESINQQRLYYQFRNFCETRYELVDGKIWGLTPDQKANIFKEFLSVYPLFVVR